MEALSVAHLSKTYRNGVHALKNISFDVDRGDFFALLGPNGAGKSTTIGILTSLVKKTAGEVKILGYNIDHDFYRAKACMGIVPQEFNFNIFETVLDVMINQAGYYGIAYKEGRQRAKKYLQQFDLWGKKNSQVRTLSGGMKRRLMIARALVHHPKILILDEPTAGTDLEIRRSLWHFLTELNKAGLTVILTTHYLEEAENLCRTVAIIDAGEIIINTTIRDILKRLDTEKFILYVDNPLDKKINLRDYEYRMDDNYTMEVVVPKNSGLTPLFEQLSQQGIHVTSMKNKTNRLEEVFLTLTSGKNHVSDSVDRL